MDTDYKGNVKINPEEELSTLEEKWQELQLLMNQQIEFIPTFKLREDNNDNERTLNRVFY
jgi:hypothetical protein